MIEFRNVTKSFDGKNIVKNFSFTFPDHQITSLTGRSGIGKTTILRMILGLETPDSGIVTGTEGKRLAAVFQEDRLCEPFSARENVRLVCGKDHPASEIDRHLKMVGIQRPELPVKNLSGGMKRRVALVRAVIVHADILTLDEPFAGLDSATKSQVVQYLKSQLHDTLTVLVTHDPEDRIAVNAQCSLEIG